MLFFQNCAKIYRHKHTEHTVHTQATLPKHTHTLRGTAAANSFIYHTLTSDTVRLCPYPLQKMHKTFVFEIWSNQVRLV